MLSVEAWVAVAAIAYNTYLTQRNGQKSDEVREVGRRNAGAISEVHELVNDAATKQNKRIDQLTDTLVDADVDVPHRPANGHGNGA